MITYVEPDVVRYSAFLEPVKCLLRLPPIAKTRWQKTLQAIQALGADRGYVRSYAEFAAT